jgi:GTPase-associated protein 1, N-terminal domain type 2
MKIEQLYYSWAARGIEGRNRLQIVAASPGLANRDFSLCRAALRLCQYTCHPRDLAEGPPPVSYGWLDDEATRFWFRRQDAGLGGDGRPGNFIAHILTGPPRSLPTNELLCRFASPFWESTARGLAETEHGGLDLRLPLVNLDDIPPADQWGAPSSEELGALVELLLSGAPQPRIAFALEPGEIVDLLRIVTGSLRPLFERTAFSTYESERMRRQFDLVGMGRHGRADLGFQSLSGSSTVAVSSKAKSVARLMLSSKDEDSHVLAATVGASTTPQGALDLERFAELAKRVDDVGRQPINMNRLHAALSSPSVFRTALNYGSVRKAIAEAIAESDDDVKDALRLAARDLPEDLLRELGANTAEALIERSRVQELDRLMDQLIFISPAIEDGLLDTILRRLVDGTADTGGPSFLSAKTLRELLRYARRTPAVPPEAITSVVANGAQYYRQLVPDHVLPTEWRARMLADALIGHRAKASDVAALIGQEPGLLSAVGAPGDAGSILATVLGSQPMQSVLEMTSALALELSLPLRLNLVCSVGELLPLKDRLTFLAVTGPLCGEAVNDLHWTSIVESTIQNAIRQALTHPDEDPTLLMIDIDQLSTLTSIPQVHNFGMLIHLACWSYQDSEQRARVTATAFERFSDSISACLAASLGFDYAIGEATSMSQVSSVVHILGDRVDSDKAVQVAAILRSALRRATLYENGERCAVASLSYIATSYVDPMSLPLTTNGELESADLQGLAARIARLITDRGWVEATNQIAQRCGSSMGWWSTLEEARTNGDAQS